MKIHLNNMVFYGFHGVHPAERELGQRFNVTLTLTTDDSLDEKIETLDDTIDYTKIYAEIARIMENEKYQLLERLANAIIETLFSQHEKIKILNVRIRKPSVPIQGPIDSAEIEMERCRK